MEVSAGAQQREAWTEENEPSKQAGEGQGRRTWWPGAKNSGAGLPGCATKRAAATLTGHESGWLSSLPDKMGRLADRQEVCEHKSGVYHSLIFSYLTTIVVLGPSSIRR